MNDIKKIIAWPIAWTLFWLGHGVSKLMHIESKLMHIEYLGRLYPIYNRLMIWSVQWNDWADLSIWGQATKGS